MSMSENVVQDTLRVLRKAADLTVAAEALELSEEGLKYRIYNNPTIMALAIERGLYKPRKKTESASIPANNISGKGQSEPHTKAQPEPKAKSAPSNESGKSYMPGSEPSSTMGQFDKNADLSKPPEETKAPNPAPEPTAIQPRTARPRGHGRNKPGWKTFDVTMQEESYALLVEIADREDRHVNIQAGRMLREVLEQMK